MTTAYHASVWRKALNEAEGDVMRATATPPGGKKEGEDLMAYVERTKQIQGAAIARWMTAKAELEAAEGRA
jgi:beta-phosphoglucomutase-like phosphatase (HAD superfamily)